MNTNTATQPPSEAQAQSAGENKLMQALLIAAIAASGLSMIFSIGTAYVSASQDTNQSVSLVEHTLD
ncbi:MAG: hypothetical protein AB8C13_00140 [Phycisphaerales bacterium]